MRNLDPLAVSFGGPAREQDAAPVEEVKRAKAAVDAGALKTVDESSIMKTPTSVSRCVATGRKRRK